MLCAVLSRHGTGGKAPGSNSPKLIKGCCSDHRHMTFAVDAVTLAYKGIVCQIL